MKKTNTSLSELSERELLEEKVQMLRIIVKRQKSIDGNTTFLFWLGLLALLACLVYFLFL